MLVPVISDTMSLIAIVAVYLSLCTNPRRLHGPVPFVALLCLVGTFTAGLAGYVTSDVMARGLLAFTALLISSVTRYIGHVSRTRVPSFPWSLLMLAVAAVFCVGAIELPSAQHILKPRGFAMEWGLSFLLLMTVTYAGRRRPTPALLTVTALYGIGLAEHFVVAFKSMPIAPGDLFALGTAATVAGSYSYGLDWSSLYGMSAYLMALLFAWAACETRWSGIRLTDVIKARKARRERVRLLLESGSLGSIKEPEETAVADGRDAVSIGGAEEGHETATAGEGDAPQAGDALCHEEPSTNGPLGSPAGNATGNDDGSREAVGDNSVPGDADATNAPHPSALSRVGKAIMGISVDRRTAILAGGALIGQLLFLDYYDTLGIKVSTWQPLKSYFTEGFMPSFISSAQKMVPTKPKGYKGARAEALISRLGKAYSPKRGDDTVAQFSDERPSVVCIMNESFADLSIYDGLRAGYEGPKRLKSIPDALFQGISYMSAFGAGTCNSEFEFLTGSTMQFLGAGVYPYMTYNLEPVPNLARKMRELGYSTTAMHPNHATNWNRENVYQDMGFDEFISLDSFMGAEEMCGKVTDRATYQKVLEVLSRPGSHFIHDVTMEGHSGYKTGLVPPDKQVYVTAEGDDDSSTAELDEYLALNEDGDEAFAWFLSQLRAFPKPVVVAFYGDHQPYFTDRYNDRYFTGEQETEHTERQWQTRYVVWANYDVTGMEQRSEQVDASIGYVGLMTMEAIGAPLDDYERARLSLRDEMPAINVIGQTDGSEWGNPDSDVALHAREDMRSMQYRRLFDHGQPIFALRLQDQANETDAKKPTGTDAEPK